jgi:hypothetical protein
VGKYTYTFAAGVLVIIQGLLTFVVPAEQIAWIRWRVGAVVIAVLAIIALAMQLRRQAQEEKRANEEQEKRERKRDKKIDELLRRVPKSKRTQDAAYAPSVTPNETLAERVERLAHEYYDCLQEGITRSTYESRLRPKLLELLPELRKSPFEVNISDADIEPKQLYAGMRETADTLALAAAKMENPKMKSEGGFLVLDE